MLDDHSVDKNEDGEICLDLPDHKKWKIVRAGESFMLVFSDLDKMRRS